MTRSANKEDLKAIVNLAILMWNNQTLKELTENLNEVMEKNESKFFLYYHNDTAIGFAQCQLQKDCVQGTHSSPVACLKGIYIREEFRHNGYGTELLKECEKWAISEGCKEFASDCEFKNVGSQKFHQSAGFLEANKIICYVKNLVE